jgi:S1-C subfamily serine protease
VNMELRDDNQTEIHSSDDDAVKALVGTLKHIEAPANFERRVMSAISSGDRSRRPFAFLTYAIPVVLVLLVATFFIFRSTGQQTPADQPTIAHQKAQPAALPPTVATETPEVVDNSVTAESNPIEQPQVQSTLPKRNAVRPTDVNSAPGGGSFDEGQKQTKTPLPQGIVVPTSPNAPDPDEVMTHLGIPVREVLAQIGITAERSEGWHVKNVTPKSPAAHSGVLVGDVVIALGDKDISARDDLETGGSVSSLKVRRGDKVIVLPLKN